jgi:hypothetical protein
MAVLHGRTLDAQPISSGINPGIDQDQISLCGVADALESGVQSVFSATGPSCRVKHTDLPYATSLRA